MSLIAIIATGNHWAHAYYAAPSRAEDATGESARECDKNRGNGNYINLSGSMRRYYSASAAGNKLLMMH